jgi:SWI/SNF-related matrix-associated actin-dependent regulator 1 of chromatin subfamily A
MTFRQLFADLYQHQQDELRHLVECSSNRLLAWEMGSGKTPVAARLYWARLLASEGGRLLYLCPASIKQQVARELRRWGPPGLRVQILQTGADRLDPNADAIVVNYDLLLADPLFEQLLAERWLLLVLDESHLLRTPTAIRTRRVLGQAPCLAGSARRVLALSGTPVVNSPLDLFPLVNRLFPRAIAVDGQRMQRAEFEHRYIVHRAVNVGHGRTIRQPIGGKNLDELHAKLAPYMSRVRLADVLDLPPLQLVEFALMVELDEVLEAEAALPPALRAAIAAAAQADDTDALPVLLRRHARVLTTLRRLLGTVKAPAAAEHIAERLEAGEDRVAGFFHHRDVSDLVCDHLGVIGHNHVGVIRGDTPSAARAKALDMFDAGELPVLLLQNHSGSLGLNLQAARYCCIVEPDWTDATTQQAIGRLNRAGQQRAVTVEFLLVPNSLDEHVVGAARRKAAIAADLIEPRMKEIA